MKKYSLRSLRFRDHNDFGSNGKQSGIQVHSAIRRLALLACCCSAAAVPAAQAAAPAEVTVRVEGTTATLVPRTKVITTVDAVNKDGQAGHTCSGTSALGALNLVTAGDWAGSWGGMGGYFVNTIKGTNPAAANEFWSYWQNRKSSMFGLCGVELAQGDEILLFPDCFGMGCTNPKPLGLTVQPKAAAGEQVPVKVVHYEPDGREVPEAGVAITVADQQAQTDAEGKATVTIGQAGEFEILAQKQGFVRDSGQKVCVYSNGNGCGFTSRPGGCSLHVAQCTLPLDPLRPDKSAPQLAFAIPSGKVFRRSRAPRLLEGSVQDYFSMYEVSSGVRQLAFQLQRKQGKRCMIFSGTKERFHASKCQADVGYIDVVPKDNGGSSMSPSQWSYLLPSRLPVGRYRVATRAIDKANNTARQVVYFRVK